MEISKLKNVRELIPEFEEYLEKDYKLITEAIGDIVTIARLNKYEDAIELIRKQFVVIDKQDLEEED